VAGAAATAAALTALVPLVVVAGGEIGLALAEANAIARIDAERNVVAHPAHGRQVTHLSARAAKAGLVGAGSTSGSIEVPTGRFAS